MREDKKIEELGQSLEEMFETMRAIQGEEFCDFVSFVMNQGSLLKLNMILISESLDEKRNVMLDPAHELKLAYLRILSHTTKAYGEALGLTEEKVQEAMKFSEKMTIKIQQLENNLEQEDE